jgi:type I restriction enzyme, S subunit
MNSFDTMIKENIIPKNWIYVTLNEISKKIHYGYTASSSKQQIGPKFLRITDIQNNHVNWDTVPYCKIGTNELNKYLLESGDLLFARTGATVGKSYLIEEEIPKSIFASYLIRIRLSNLIKKKYVYTFFQSSLYWNQIHQKKIGIGQPNVNGNTLSKITLPIPPFNEQKRIVTKLEELFTKLDAGIEYLKKNQILLKQYRQSVLKYAFEGKLTEKWRKSNSIIHFDDSILREIEKQIDKNEVNVGKQPKLPSLWKWVKLGDIYNITMGQSPPGNSYNYEGKGMPLLNGPTEFGEIYPTPVQWTNKITKISEKNELLICVRGNTTGRMNWSNQKYCIGRGLASIRPKFPTVNNKILFFFLQMKIKELISFTTGSTFPNLTRDKLTKFLFPLIPNNEQIYIVQDIEKKFSIIKNIEITIKHHLKYATKLRNSILKYAFEGKLVPQDPNEEPAEILLERIKRERESTIPIKKEKSKITKREFIDNDSKQMRLM